MCKRIVLCLMMFIGLTLNVQTVDAAITGKVKNQAGVGIANASLSLAVLKAVATSGADGSYSLATTSTILPQLVPQTEKITLNNGVLKFNLHSSSPVKVEIFDVNGNLVKKDIMQNAQAGTYRMNLGENTRAANVLVIHASIGKSTTTFRYLPLNIGKLSVNSSVQNFVVVGGKQAKTTAFIDTLKVTATNYSDKTILISKLDTTLDIALDTLDDNAVTVQLAQEKQTIQGFGINATIMPSGKSLPWKQLFSTDLTTKDALGLSILRIGMHENGDHRSVPSDWETARTTYGAKIIGSCWSAPATMKSNNKTTAGGYLKPANYADWAKMIAEYAKKYKLYAMSIANESDFASCGSGSGEKPCSAPLTDEYESMTYTAKQMVEFVKTARKAFNQYAPDVKMIAPEASLWIHVWSNLSCKDQYKSSDPHGCGCFSNDINDAAALAQCAQKCTDGDGYNYGHWLAKDTAAWNAFDIMGVHQYESQVAYPWPADVTNGKRSKDVWQTEMSGVMYWPEQGPSTSIENGVAVARWIQSGLTVGEASAWCYWWYEAYYQNDNEGLALTKGGTQIAKRYYAMGNYSRYIRPGHKIVNVTGTKSLPAKVLLTASKGDDGTVVIVAINETTSAQSVPIKIAGGTVPASFKQYVTDGTKNWTEGSAVTVTTGVLTAQLEKMSVTTFVGK
jgi:O-glycosyl hydrolase